MKRIIVILMLFAGFTASAQEVYTSSGKPAGSKRYQKDESGFDWSKLIVGGGLGLSFGDYTSISISPIVGYRFTDHFAAGIGMGYQYLKIKDYIQLTDLNQVTSYYDYKSSIFSPSVWTRYLITDNIFAHVEYEHNFMSFQNFRFAQNGSGNIESYQEKLNAPSLLVGGGFRSAIGDHASFTIAVLYDVIQDDNSPYKNRIFPRIGFNLGF
jgi:hypothetical protein